MKYAPAGSQKTHNSCHLTRMNSCMRVKDKPNKHQKLTPEELTEVEYYERLAREQGAAEETDAVLHMMYRTDHSLKRQAGRSSLKLIPAPEL